MFEPLTWCSLALDIRDEAERTPARAVGTATTIPLPLNEVWSRSCRGRRGSGCGDSVRAAARVLSVEAVIDERPTSVGTSGTGG